MGATLTLPTDPAALGYLAGLLDGEGSIHIRPNGRVQISIYQSHLPLMEWLAKTGIGFRDEPMRSHGPIIARKQPYVWMLTKHSECEQFLEALLPNLIVKRDQALKALASIKALASQTQALRLRQGQRLGDWNVERQSWLSRERVGGRFR